MIVQREGGGRFVLPFYRYPNPHLLMSKLTLDDLRIQGKRVLIRVDFNVPLLTDEAGMITVADDTRIRAALPTLRAVLDRGGLPILMSHLGRPGGDVVPGLSLAPVARHLERLLQHPVHFVPALVGETVEKAIASATPGKVLLLENTRFHPGEKSNDPALAAALAALADVYVNDAFGAAHRAHASTEGVAHHVAKAAMGYLLEREVTYLQRVLDAPERPFVAVLGGAKVSDKIGVIENLLGRVEALLIGGAMSYTFLKAQGVAVGTSLVEDDRLEVARKLMDRSGDRILLPIDHVAAPSFSNEAPPRQVRGPIPEGEMGLDIGPETVALYRRRLLEARTVVWNGPMGVFEMPNFARGTFAVAEALAETTRHGALTIVGGGDSVAAINQSGFEEAVSHVSTGGGAMLEFLEGKTLPGIAALTDRPASP